MTATDPFSSPSYVRRTKDGRPYVWNPERKKEVAYTRVTNFIDCLEDKTMLARWGERMALIGVRDEAHLGRELMKLKPVPALPDNPTHDDVLTRNGLLDEEKKALNDLIADAKDAAGHKDRAALGTLVHELTELVDGGGRLPANTPLVLADDVRAYQAALERFGLEPVEQEVFVANDELKAAGTFDRIYLWHREGHDPVRVLGDLKTGRVDYGQGKLAMQLALYANSKRYDPENPRARGELDVDPDTGLIIHLPVGEANCRVYGVDLKLGWRGVQLADEVRTWRRETRNGVLNDLALEFDLEAMLRGS